MISKKYSLVFFMLIASLIECGGLDMKDSFWSSKIFDSTGECYFDNSTLIAEIATLAHLEGKGNVVLEVKKELELNNATVIGTLIIKKAKKIQINNSIIENLVLEDGAADPVFHNCDVKKIIDRRGNQPEN